MVLRHTRKAVRRGGYGVDRKLPRMENTEDVFWSANHNSFVVVPHDTEYGEFNIFSINGIGEIRWQVFEWMKDAESESVRDYFFER